MAGYVGRINCIVNFLKWQWQRFEMSDTSAGAIPLPRQSEATSASKSRATALGSSLNAASNQTKGAKASKDHEDNQRERVLREATCLSAWKLAGATRRNLQGMKAGIQFLRCRSSACRQGRPKRLKEELSAIGVHGHCLHGKQKVQPWAWQPGGPNLSLL